MNAVAEIGRAEARIRELEEQLKKAAPTLRPEAKRKIAELIEQAESLAILGEELATARAHGPAFAAPADERGPRRRFYY